MAKTKTKQPPNFVDLRQPLKKSKPQLIQDVLLPSLRRSRRPVIKVSVILILIGLIALGLLIGKNRANLDISKSGLDIYYPKQNQLPAGYVLHKASQDTAANAVLYTIYYGGGQKIVVTVQKKPDNSTLQTFSSKIIPLHTNLNTDIGLAEVGAANGEQVISLPTNGNSWLLITAPNSLSQKNLNQVLKAF